VGLNSKDKIRYHIAVNSAKLSKERRSLMEDGVELQRRLDELTPLLAEKEAKIAKLENEKEEFGGRLRSASLQVSSLQVGFLLICKKRDGRQV
jgi:chromosome segregation ATPase